ncbi:hypothetical protein [Conexibacter woesei]|uniref:Uncharacterized protein n=1 Tax=Conexibacter woesei (strain DSM 14684 / CCUG 47730 / CIP 108061 / JCM 11494 / NBRC 100937 / ID131577) TaxID=469383 RepID=D3EZM0_CONWI|nr:hypothetical protein [Conexibacter woesei]ADB53858.1 hypothetical protein Cwoe_5453 [Conexibacter woesei DSM 14684]
MRAARNIAVAAATLLLGGAQCATAAGKLPDGRSDGVRIVREGGRMAVVFDKRASAAYRQIAGRTVTISCVKGLGGSYFDISGSRGSSDRVRAARTRRPLRTRDLARGADFCRVALPERRGRDGRTTVPAEPVAAIPLTERGTIHLDEQAKAIAVYVLLEEAVDNDGGRSPSHFLPAPRLFELLRRDDDAWASIELTELASPDDTPPAGALGYYSDGGRHAAAVVRSTNGRRLYHELGPDLAISSNVLGYVFSIDDGMS